MPILSRMHSGVPGRQASLLTATGASRTAFAQSVMYAVADLAVDTERNAAKIVALEERLDELEGQLRANAD